MLFAVQGKFKLQLQAGNDAAGLLQLAMNSSNAATAAAAARYPPDQLQQSLARKLFATAAERQHKAAVQRMAGLKFMQQHVDVPTLLTALPDSALKLKCVDAMAELAYYQAVTSMPAAAQIDSNTAADLLKRAVRFSNASAVKAFVSLPAAQQLDSEIVTALLHRAASVSSWINGSLISPLCTLPAAQQLTSEAVAALLCSATGRFIHHDPDLRFELQPVCALPGAQQMPAELLVKVMRTAVQFKHTGVIEWLRQIASAGQIKCHDVSKVGRRQSSDSSSGVASEASLS
jgi:hypothetical protein